MLNLFRAEIRKFFTGPAVWVLLVIAVALGALFTQGFVEEAHRSLEAGLSDVATQTAVVVRAWFSITLFAGLAGAMTMTREYSAGTMARTVLVGVRRQSLLLVKAGVAALIGLGFGLLGAALSVAGAYGLMPIGGPSPVWSHEATLTVLGIVGGSVLSAIWGVAVASIVRHQTATILLIVLVSTFVGPGVQALWPHVAGYLFTIALTGVTLDGKEGLLSVNFSYAVLLAWIVVLGWVATLSFRRRDIV